MYGADARFPNAWLRVFSGSGTGRPGRTGPATKRREVLHYFQMEPTPFFLHLQFTEKSSASPDRVYCGITGFQEGLPSLALSQDAASVHVFAGNHIQSSPRLGSLVHAGASD